MLFRESVAVLVVAALCALVPSSHASEQAEALKLPATNVTTYIINLDLEPADRFVEVVTKFKAELGGLIG